MGSATVFISYARADAEFAERLKADLRAAGVTIWIDHESIPPGEGDWQWAIRRGIEAATAVVYIGSPDAAQSVNVGSEVLIAQAKHRQIIPLWARGDHWTESAPFELMRANYLDARDAAYPAAAAHLCQELGAISSRTPLEMAKEAVEQGTALLKTNQYAESLAVFEQAVALDPQNVDAWAGKGLALMGIGGRIQEALAAAAQAQAVFHQ